MNPDVNQTLIQRRSFRYRSPAIQTCPQEGNGVHKWLFASACTLARSGVSQENATSFLIENASRHDPREIDDAVRNAYVATQTGYRSASPNRFRPLVRPAAWPTADLEHIQRIEASGYGLADLWEESPLRIDPGTTPREVLGLLFASDDLITAAVIREASRTSTFSEWGDSINRCRLIVPNAAAERQGLTKDVRPSQRAKSMFPHRSYLVVEFDGGSLDQQAARIRYLATMAPLVLVVFSGSKSLHAWFRCQNVEEALLRPFFAEACRLGADPATWQPHQLVRLPEGIREVTQTRQAVYYLNPSHK